MRGALVLIALALGGTAVAEPAPRPQVVWEAKRPGADVVAHDGVSNIIYLERCAGGCTIYKGSVDNAPSYTSTIPDGNGPFFVSEFGYPDEMWNEIVACVRETYAPYNVQVTDVKPATGLYHMAVVAGEPSEVGLPNYYGGVGHATCDPVNNAVSYVFANHVTADAFWMCAAVAQESGHTWGLDHAFDCSDPMTYLPACGQQFFRNKQFRCGEGAPRDCVCSGAYQNSHIRLLTVFGPGAPLPQPVVEMQDPAGDTQVSSGFAVAASATAKRGFGHAELLLNGYVWARADGEVGTDTQVFSFTTSPELPDSIIDVEVRVYDDLDQGYGSSAVTVTKGAPCASADTCAVGQKCEDGRCFWDPPAGELGAACEYPQFCTTGECYEGTCSRACLIGVTGDCPADFTCVAADGNDGFCLPGDGGPKGCGCASSDGGALAHLGFALVVLGVIGRRRRPTSS